MPSFLTGPEEISNKQFVDQNLSKYSIASNNLRELIQDDRDLAKQLAENSYKNYKGLRYERLEREAAVGNLDKHEFRKLLIQDFAKTSAKIWKEHTVFVGVWKKTLNQLEETLFKTNFIGKNNHFHKEKCLEYLKVYRWKLNFARKWFLKHKDVNALYPSLYFDRTRIKSQEIGFFGLESVYKSHLKYSAKRITEKKEQQHASSKRKRVISQQQKLTRAIKKFETGKMDYNQLYQYVQNNLHVDYLLQLPQLIIKHTQNLA